MSVNDEQKASVPTEKFGEYERKQKRRELLDLLKDDLPETNPIFRRVVDLRKRFDAKYVLFGFITACLWLGSMWGQIAFGWVIILCKFVQFPNSLAIYYHI